MNIYIDLRYTCPSRVSFLAGIEISSAITGDNSLAAVPKSWKISFSPLRNAAPYCSKTPSSPDRPLAGQFGRKTRKFPEIVTANPSNQFIPVALEKKKEGRRRRSGKLREKDGREGTRRKTAVKSASEEEEVLADLRAAVAGRALIFVTEY